MASFFAVLGLEETLTLDPQEVEAAWQALAKEAPVSADPSTPETPEQGSEIHRARSVLLDPVARLEHWLELRGISPGRGTAMAPDLMDLFSRIHAALEKADSVSRRHRVATTALAKALLAREAIEAQLAVQDCLRSIQAQKSERIARFPEFETPAAPGEIPAAAATLGQLKFLKKWEQQCQERLLQLIEC